MKTHTGPLMAKEKLTHPDGLAAVEIVKAHLRAMESELVTKGYNSWVCVLSEHAIVDTTPPNGTWRAFASSGAMEFVIHAGINDVGASREVICDYTDGASCGL
ncbi:MAG: hypothetical protein IPH08_03730 [Rhodocyclaceae bacterium]|nr:hypothetical protein [Rhodocyclaceae bacterium]MBK6906263.1 hypothetical protein [Rhodocyclaceae bacterium]